jgi:hypothetical protein
MKMISSVVGVGLLAAVAGTPVLAQSVDLTGTYKCIQTCRMGLVGSPAFVTQNGPQLNLLNEAGQASRAWPDWYAPATRIWIENYGFGAVYSADGMLIQFDNGTIWQRDLGLPPPPPPTRRRK